jgi:hypothetical protein
LLEGRDELAPPPPPQAVKEATVAIAAKLTWLLAATLTCASTIESSVIPFTPEMLENLSLFRFHDITST